MSDASETVALANKVLDLLEKGATQVGQTASTAFPLIVRFEWAQALTGLGVGLVFLAISIASIFGFLRSNKKREVAKAAGKYCGDEGVLVVWSILAIVTFIISMAFVGINVPTVIEPTGHTIEYLLRKAS